jgi:hypothetical protein
MLYPNKFSGDPAIFAAETKSSLPNVLQAIKNTSGVVPKSSFVAGLKVSATLNFPNTSAATSSDLTIPCIGANIGDEVVLGSPAPPTNSSYTAFVSGADVVTVRFVNSSAGAINPGSGTFTCTVSPS